MSLRPDITDNIIHFTRGVSDEDAISNLNQIIRDQHIIGGTTTIRGSYECVCFTEAPLMSLQNGLINPYACSNYSPFGIIMEKQWLFDLGGRPVIYQPESEFDNLPESHRWRHVRYEPGIIDFTWEREWRINCDKLRFDQNTARIIVPTIDWAYFLIEINKPHLYFEIYPYSKFMNLSFNNQFEDNSAWKIFVLE